MWYKVATAFRSLQNPREYVPSAIETSVRKGHLEVLGDPLVQTLLQTKWQRFGQATFLAQVSLYLVWVVSQTFLVWLHSDRVRDARAWASHGYGVERGGRACGSDAGWTRPLPNATLPHLLHLLTRCAHGKP